ncbi:MAG: hypothetical protein GYB53_22205 [Rhodobacteraceae bacterium]|nr:hypothetical protein [Paracoccaceae bacterium]MBR9823718.1 hypothetical protein [Paracoccaceae bacterium]
MAQNRSAAVMQQRHEPADSFYDFPTPPWATRALCEALAHHGFDLSQMDAWEPCCNRGYMAGPLGEYFRSVFASDVMDYGYPGQDAIADFLINWAADAPRVDFVVMNPPFKLGLEFIQQGLRHARVGVAAFVRSSFVEGQERYQELFSVRPEALVMPFVERVALWKGVLLDPDVPIWREKPDHPDGGKLERPTSATSYSWLVWIKPPMWNGRSEHRRIAPCRLRLTRPGDYPPLPDHLRAPETEGLL